MSREQAAQWISRRLRLLVVLTALASTFTALASAHWFLELFSHFALHYAASALLLAAALAALGSRRWAGAALVIAIANNFMIWQAMPAQKRPDHARAGPQLSIFHFNGAVRNHEPQRVVEYLLANAQRVDVVVLIEANARWMSALERLETAFPHVVQSPHESPFGLAVLSRHKPDTADVVAAPSGYRHIEIRLIAPGAARPVRIYAVHAPPPISAEMAAARNEKLEYIARMVRGRPHEAAIVVGDFNLTPYSPHFRRFAQSSGLHWASSSWLPQATWPALFGSAWFGIPIDHSFIAPGMNLISRRVGPDMGSDHLPVQLTVALE